MRPDHDVRKGGAMSAEDTVKSGSGLGAQRRWMAYLCLILILWQLRRKRVKEKSSQSPPSTRLSPTHDPTTRSPPEGTNMKKAFHPVNERVLLYACAQATEGAEDVRTSVPYLVSIFFLWFVVKAESSRDSPLSTGAHLYSRVGLRTESTTININTGGETIYYRYNVRGCSSNLGEATKAPRYSHPHCSATRTQVPIVRTP